MSRRGAPGARGVWVPPAGAGARHHATDVLVLNHTVVGFGPPELALSDHCLERAYGHVGHGHPGVLP